MPHYTRISAEFELITPAFIGGAYKDTLGSIDPKAIKAALRYWWRVLHWDEIRNQEQNDATALARLHQAEMRLFGFASNKSHGGQGLVQVSVKPITGLGLRKLSDMELKAGTQYLLGQGLFSSKLAKGRVQDGLLRSALGEGKFVVTLILHHPRLDQMPDMDQNQLLAALRAFGLLGNLGTRQNRGFGSVRMTHLQNRPFAPDIESYTNELSQLIKKPRSPMSLLPSFCDQARLKMIVPIDGKIRVLMRKEENAGPRPTKDRLIPANSVWALLNAIGEEFLVERSSGYGANGLRKTLGGFVAQCFYEDDHHWITKAKSLQSRRHSAQKDIADLKKMPPPIRMIYGLPYGFDQGKEIGVKLGEKTEGRRASPLHIHVTALDGQALAVVYSLPSLFLPSDAKLHIKLGAEPSNDPDLPVPQVSFQFAKMDDFFNRFTSAKSLL